MTEYNSENDHHLRRFFTKPPNVEALRRCHLRQFLLRPDHWDRALSALAQSAELPSTSSRPQRPSCARPATGRKKYCGCSANDQCSFCSAFTLRNERFVRMIVAKAESQQPCPPKPTETPTTRCRSRSTRPPTAVSPAVPSKPLIDARLILRARRLDTYQIKHAAATTSAKTTTANTTTANATVANERTSTRNLVRHSPTSLQPVEQKPVSAATAKHQRAHFNTRQRGEPLTPTKDSVEPSYASAIDSTMEPHESGSATAPQAVPLPDVIELPASETTNQKEMTSLSGRAIRSAVVIQSWARGSVARSRVRKMHRAATAIQCAFRGMLRRRGMIQALLRLQRVGRGDRMRRKLHFTWRRRRFIITYCRDRDAKEFVALAAVVKLRQQYCEEFSLFESEGSARSELAASRLIESLTFDGLRDGAFFHQSLWYFELCELHHRNQIEFANTDSISSHQRSFLVITEKVRLRAALLPVENDRRSALVDEHEGAHSALIRNFNYDTIMRVLEPTRRRAIANQFFVQATIMCSSCALRVVASIPTPWFLEREGLERDCNVEAAFLQQESVLRPEFSRFRLALHYLRERQFEMVLASSEIDSLLRRAAAAGAARISALERS